MLDGPTAQTKTREDKRRDEMVHGGPTLAWCRSASPDSLLAAVPALPRQFARPSCFLGLLSLPSPGLDLTLEGASFTDGIPPGFQAHAAKSSPVDLAWTPRQVTTGCPGTRGVGNLEIWQLLKSQRLSLLFRLPHGNNLTQTCRHIHVSRHTCRRALYTSIFLLLSRRRKGRLQLRYSGSTV
jgi:hypothetical protein